MYNSWGQLLGWISLCHTQGVEPSLEDLLSILDLKKQPHVSGVYYVSLAKSQQPVIDLADSNSGWKDKFVFVSGQIGNVPTRLGVLRKGCF